MAVAMELKYRVWKRKDGSEVRIKDMTDQHLVNAIGYLRRKAEYDCANQDCGSYYAPEVPLDYDLFESPQLEHLEFEARVRSIEI
jgi:hypothetical protein